MDLIGPPITLSSPEGAQAARKETRMRAAKVLTDSDCLDSVELMASEAVTNALVHGSGVIDVTVAADQQRLRVEVRDQGPATRAVGRVDHGRGLEIIAALATSWALVHEVDGTCLLFEVSL